MKKSLIALAALAAVSAASAQSTVTLFGVVDLGLQATKATVDGVKYKQTSVANGVQSGSRIGFKGAEDLGGGLKANFVVEGGITPDEAALTWSNRQSYLGLEGAFGTVNIGRQYTLHHSNQGAADLTGNIGNAGYIGGLDSLVRFSNAITYTSPSFSGFVGAVQLGLGETITSGSLEKKDELAAVRLTYTNGPLAAGFASESVKNPTAAVGEVKFAGVSVEPAVTADKRKANNLFASYDLGVAKVSFLNNTSKFTTDGAGSEKWKANTLFASAPMGAVTLLASVGNGKATADGVTDSIKAKAYQLGASYALSKRTNVYAFTGQTKFTYSTAGVAADKLSQTVAGVRHSF